MTGALLAHFIKARARTMRQPSTPEGVTEENPTTEAAVPALDSRMHNERRADVAWHNRLEKVLDATEASWM
jgi:hypothetical protein